MNSSDSGLSDGLQTGNITAEESDPIVLNFTKSEPDSSEVQRNANQPVLIRNPEANIYEALNHTNITINLFDFAIVIFYVLLIVFIISMSYALRKEIKVVVVRLLSLLGLLPYLRELRRSCINIFRTRSKEEIQAQDARNKIKEQRITYEIYNPNTGKIDDQQFSNFPSELV